MAEILIVDDDVDIRTFIATALRGAGHHVMEASDGREGLRILGSQPLQLVITDLLMPEMDGLELLRTLRKTFPTLPAIAVSGGSPHSSIYLSTANHLGAVRILHKPFLLTSLLEAVEGVLARRAREAGRPGAGPGMEGAEK